MQFDMTRRVLAQALDRSVDVGTKSNKADFELNDLVTMQAVNGQVKFTTSNGYLESRVIIEASADDNLDVTTDGIISANSTILQKIVKSLGGPVADDHTIRIQVATKGQSAKLKIKDISSKKTRSAEMVVVTSVHHKIDFVRPAKGFACSFPVGTFRQAVKNVAKYYQEFQYKPRYKMVLCHLLPDETRFVCGDGGRFAVWSTPEVGAKVQKDGVRFLLPSLQAQVLESVCGDDGDIELVMEGKESCYVRLTSSNVELYLKGIADTNYVAYENHAYRMDDAVAIIDIPRSELAEAMGLVGSVRDKEREAKNRYHSTNMHFKADGELSGSVDEGKYRCSFTAPIDFYSLDGSTEFVSKYAWEFLSDIVHSSTCEFIRFFAISPDTTILAQPIDITDTKDDNGVPAAKESPDKSSLIFFFQSVHTKQETPSAQPQAAAAATAVQAPAAV